MDAFNLQIPYWWVIQIVTVLCNGKDRRRKRNIKSLSASTYSFFSLFLAFIFKSVGIGQIVDSDGQEDVEQDVVTTDEQDDEVKTEK